MAIEHWTTAYLTGANASFQRAAREYAEEYAAMAVAEDRERICLALPGGWSVDPQWVADMVRDGPTCGKRLNRNVRPQVTTGSEVSDLPQAGPSLTISATHCGSTLQPPGSAKQIRSRSAAIAVSSASEP